MDNKEHSPRIFIEVSEGYLESIKLISEKLNNKTLYTFGLLSCLAIETSLKAILLKEGVETSSLRKIGHNIEGLWEKVFELGVRINPDFRSTVTIYSKQRNATVSFRYPVEGTIQYVNSPIQTIHDIEGIINYAKNHITNEKDD